MKVSQVWGTTNVFFIAVENGVNTETYHDGFNFKKSGGINFEPGALILFIIPYGLLMTTL